MPGRQVNVKMTEEEAAKFDALVERITQRTGVPVKAVQVYRMAIAALEREYPADDQGPAPEQQEGKGRGKGKK